MRRLFAVLLIAAPLTAQTAPASGPLVAIARAQWMAAHNYILRTAQMVPDSLYGFRPIAGVRSFAELFGHVAASEMSYCAAVIGDPGKDESVIEKSVTSRATAAASLNDAAKYCERAYSITDADAASVTKIFNRDRLKMYGLMENATHDWEHYGNLVTYLRINRMVPPSSQ